MKHFFIIFPLFLLTILSFGQVSNKTVPIFINKNSVQVELFGHGLFYSLNYERLILNSTKFKTTVQIGCSYYPPVTDIRDFWFPILINEIFTFNQHHFELGVGQVYINEAIRDNNNKAISWIGDKFLTARIGYRFQKPDSHLIIRAGFTPIMEYTEGKEFHPLGGVAFGYSF